MRFIVPYVFVLVYWVLFFISNTFPQISYYTFGILLIWSLVTIGIISGRTWRNHWNLWVNFILYLVSSFIFSLIIVSPYARQLYIMLGGLFSGIVLFIILRSLNTVQTYLAKNYLLVISFVHVITFWQIATVLYFTVVSYDAKILPALSILTIVTYVLGRGVVGDQGLKKSSFRLVSFTMVLTVVQLGWALSLLPIHHYVLASVLTAWFFYLIEIVLAGQEVSSRKTLFKRYTSLLVFAVSLLLITAAWQ